jgi:hypothetical protein
MSRLQLRCVAVSAGAVLMGLALSAAAVDAAPKATIKIIPRGATAQIQGGASFMISGGGGLNETGTFDCRCTGANHGGTCVVGRGKTSIVCGASGSTCAGTCAIYTTTTGLSGGAIAQ